VVQGVSNSAAGVREGEILAGRYRVEKVLGAGGMGVVVAARHVHLDTKVAIKFLLPAFTTSPEAVGRFAREARAASKITSEHVARVFDVGTLDNGAPYLVMEFLEGEDLAAWLRQRGPLPIEQAVDFVLQACIAVADAHGLGIVHRDLKPGNLFCVRRSDGQWVIKVLDFGISKVTDYGIAGLQGAVTNTSAVLGSPLYMSPEQMRSARDVNAQTDIWALGVILFEFLTGRVPYEGESFGEIVMTVASQPPPSVRSFRPNVPVGLEAVIFKCLEKDRTQRYANVAQLGIALVPFAPRRSKAAVERISGIIQGAGLSPSALVLPPSPRTDEAGAAPETMAPVGRTTAGLSSRARKWIAIAASLGAVGGLSVWGVVGMKTSAQHASQHADGLPTSSVTQKAPTVPSAPVAPPVASPASAAETSSAAQSGAPTPSAAPTPAWSISTFRPADPVPEILPPSAPLPPAVTSPKPRPPAKPPPVKPAPPLSSPLAIAPPASAHIPSPPPAPPPATPPPPDDPLAKLRTKQ